MTGLGRRRWLAPAATLLLLVLGTVAVTTALTMALSDGDDPATTTQESTTPAAVPVVPGETSSAAPGVPSGEGPVAELADPAWVSATAKRLAIGQRALTAYAGASIAVTASHPTCGLGWNTLAAIGLVESEHGTIRGASLDASGNAAPRIFGVPLNGDGVAAVPDTDKGRLDRDTTWDRAVGPMKFIPSTWQAHATDGNQDGTPDVHNIDDAALTAATYLCSTGGDLSQPDAWIAAISAYNPDTGYNNDVAAAATRYAEASGGL